MAAMRWAMTSSSSSRFCGFSGKKSPKRSMNSSNVCVVSSPRSRWLEHLVQLGQHVLHALHLLGVDVLHRAGHLVEVALHQLLAQLVEQLARTARGPPTT